MSNPGFGDVHTFMSAVTLTVYPKWNNEYSEFSVAAAKKKYTKEGWSKDVCEKWAA